MRTLERRKALLLFLVQLFLAYIQRKIGEELGVKPRRRRCWRPLKPPKKAGARVRWFDQGTSAVTIQTFLVGYGIS